MDRDKQASNRLAAGIFYQEDRLHVTILRSKLFGHEETAAFDIPVVDGDVAGALKQLRDSDCRSVALSLDPRRLYSTLWKLTEEEEGLPSEELADAMLRGFDYEFVASTTQITLPAGKHVILTGYAEQPVANCFDGLRKRGLQHACFFPLPQALYRSVHAMHRIPKKWKTTIWIFSGEPYGLTLLVHDGTVLSWKLLDGGSLKGNTSLQLALTSLRGFAEHLGLGSIDACLECGGLSDTTTNLAIAKLLDAPVREVDALRIEPEAVSRTLALAALHRQKSEFDLFDQLRPDAIIPIKFPTRLVAGLSAAAATAILVLHAETLETEKSSQDLMEACLRQIEDLDLSIEDLQDQREALLSEVLIAESFVEDRVLWAQVLQELPDLVPDAMTLRQIEGRDAIRLPLEDQDKGSRSRRAGLRQLVLHGELRVASESTSPPEVTEFAERLKHSQVLSRDFPRVAGTTVELVRDQASTVAKIVTRCQPERD